MATRRSCRLLNKKSVVTASDTKQTLTDMDVDDDQVSYTSSSASDEEYRPSKKEAASSDEFEEDIPAKKRKQKDVPATQVSESSGDGTFEIGNIELDLSEGGTTSDESDDGKGDGRTVPKIKRSKEMTFARRKVMQTVKIPKLSDIAKATKVTLSTDSLNSKPSHRTFRSQDFAGHRKPLREEFKQELGECSLDTASSSSRSNQTEATDVNSSDKPAECLKDVINAMLLENEPQASCSYSVSDDTPDSKQTKPRRPPKKAPVSSKKRVAAPQEKRSPVKTRHRQLPAKEKAKVPAAAVKSGKHVDKTGERGPKKSLQVKKSHQKDKKAGLRDNDSSSESSDWEEVPEDVDLDSYTPVVPESGITITLQQPPMTGKHKKTKFDPVAFMRRRLNRVRKEIHTLKHKVHLLCLVAHGLKLNALLVDQSLHAVALSLLPPELLAYSGRAVTLLDIERMSRQFCKMYSCQLGAYSGIRTLHDDLALALTSRLAQNARDYAVMFLVIVRCLRIEARLCISLYPVPLDAVKLLKSDVKPGRKSIESKESCKKKKQPAEEADSDFEEEKRQKPKGKKKSQGSSPNTKQEKPEKTEESKLETQCIEHWVEVFTPKDSKWIAVDVVHGSVGSVTESHIREPLCYVLGFDDDNRVKDITRKYASAWLTSVKKKRIDPAWWEESLEPFSPPTGCERELVENTQIQSKLQRQPMPASIADFKNHPLYALKRHLLKFEAIYPPDAPTLGFVRGEAVYARECIHTLRSRETWLREARMVRVKEQPYKVVKARPRYDKLSGQILKEQPLELFGRWQTEEYMPPIAFNGKVPRNEWGNVELFKSCMLPIGTVHLKAPGLARVAAKLNIDCVPAVVGFEGHHRGCHPVFDGYVVCEEFQDTLMAAWEEEQVNISNREEEKRQKRVYGNWKKLIKGLLIKERLRTKYMKDD